MILLIQTEINLPMQKGLLLLSEQGSVAKWEAIHFSIFGEL